MGKLYFGEFIKKENEGGRHGCLCFGLGCKQYSLYKRVFQLPTKDFDFDEKQIKHINNIIMVVSESW